ncbi:MAG: GTP 3',8-cyclase MoaA [Cellvibrionales bacterium]|nr:GTP 3',8-cyclase MoaA [Cellvibrionales bacterium]|tara:strand:+ start:17476 stop:18468 length:993 start_codon:yes stop_codon:yes gene_type:complete
MNTALIDSFGREINYARLSVTDRCDFRCVYCMAEKMTFLPKKDVLSLEELYQTAVALIASGITKIRLTGGEPLIRNDIMWLIKKISQLKGLEELTLTTNGSQLVKYAEQLRACGIKRINISIDTLDAEKFQSITRTGKLQPVLDGIDAAIDAGFESIKLNSVILKNRNDDEIISLIKFAKKRSIDIAFIEEMPLGDIIEHDRLLAFCSSEEIRQIIEQEFSLTPSDKKTNGPARYFSLANSYSKIGFISPHSHNFCGDCNRIRITVEGQLLLCLGNEHAVDLRALLRQQHYDPSQLIQAIQNSMKIKPERHYFNLAEQPQIVRFMNATGG